MSSETDSRRSNYGSFNFTPRGSKAIIASLTAKYRFAFLFGIAVVLAIVFRKEFERGVSILMYRLRPKATVQERLEQYGVEARARLESYFMAAGASYPPLNVALLALKQEIGFTRPVGGIEEAGTLMRR